MRAEILQAVPASLFPLHPDHWTKPFWDAAAQRRLVAARCLECGQFRHPPTPFCPRCQSQKLDWPELSGDGSIYTFTIVRRLPIPDLPVRVPYVIAVVEPEDAPCIRFVGNIVECKLEDVRFGTAVEVAWIESASRVVPHWRLRSQSRRRLET
jgi:uncharacterized OB-fold protein